MIKNYLSVGNKLELMKLKMRDDEPIENHRYLSKLLDFIDSDKAKIAMPIERGKIIPLTVGEKYIICFFTDKGLYQCKAVITARYKEQNIYILEVQFLSELEKYQRRQFYRLECNLYIKYHIITEAEIILSNQLTKNDFLNKADEETCYEALIACQKVWNEGIITDISGGGARFISDTQLDIANPILLDIKLYDNKSHIIQVKVISSNKMANRPNFFEHRVQFNDIASEEREAIIKFIFEEERRQRKREKGLD